MRLPPSEPDSDGPNMTPVIDIVFLLLIFFLVAARLDQEEQELSVKLPEVLQAQPVSMTPELVVNVTREGKFKVSGKEYSEKQLAVLLVEARKLNPDQAVRIRADAESAWKHGVRVMDLCNRAAIKKYQVGVLPQG